MAIKYANADHLPLDFKNRSAESFKQSMLHITKLMSQASTFGGEVERFVQRSRINVAFSSSVPQVVFDEFGTLEVKNSSLRFNFPKSFEVFRIFL